MPSERPAAPDATETGRDAPARATASEDQPPLRESEPGGAPDNRDPKSEPPTAEHKRRRFESRLPGLIRRGIEKSIEAGLYTFERSLETGRETTDAVRERLGDVRINDVASAVGKALQEARLPREIAGAVLGQIDETKNDVVRIIAREVRDFLEATDLAGEIKAALTSLSFEVRTEVRFIPNDKGTGVRPDVRARGRVKRSGSASGGASVGGTGRDRKGSPKEEDGDDPDEDDGDL